MNNPSLFNPNEHLIQLKTGQTSKDYLPVQWRLVWFRALCPQGTIETEMVHLDLDRETSEEGWAWNAQTRKNEKIMKHANGFVVFKATVKDGKGGSATGTKSEKAASFPDFIEKAETGAIGRALAALGYGTQFTGDELDEAHRIVDAPVERSNHNQQDANAASSQNTQEDVHKTKATPTTTVPSSGDTVPTEITEQQIASIRKLSEHLGKAEPENVTTMNYLDAKATIQQLTADYRKQRQQSGQAAPTAPGEEPLKGLIAQTKTRAMKLGVARDLPGWDKLLSDLKIKELNLMTLSRVNEHLNKVEAGATRHAS